MTKMLTALGLMSGTSMDGIDVALLRTNGDDIEHFGPTQFFPYSIEQRTAIQMAISDARAINNRADRSGSLGYAEVEITKAHIDAVRGYLANNKIQPQSVDLIGFHGQTVIHKPEEKLTVQLGDGHGMHQALGIPIVYDLRANDISQGGQGAPLVPIYHYGLAKYNRLPLPNLIVNIGGVANITWIGENGKLIAFDTGPGNALIDDWVNLHFGMHMDLDGAIAAKGQINREVLSRLMQNPYFTRTPPKSLDRNHFNFAAVEDLSVEDATATLTAFTAHSLAASIKHLPKFPKMWVITGGGAFNPTLCKELASAILGYGEADIRRAGDLGWQSNFIEAQAFAYLAVRAHYKMPVTFPGTTGVQSPLSAGQFAGFSEKKQ